ncbi:hypothetical protein [Microvirga thermotolerans]|uniref:DUF3035 domain-containing protein n=1 Tax=Microvirga thermotolerans TaxID=2651334 RepID=A0A5P9JVN6_9HYPH|nr:hypothetical protein [Microvirga thermotolerans]QFU15716.1 hypothetical protein GDR74_05500 [Microvirga thermotolerans]
MKGLKVIGCAGALALLVAATGASAEEGEAVKSLLGSIGIIPKEKPPIQYNERPPLVLPPKMELRPPVAGGAEARNANWPKDPDVAAARKAAAEARTPYTSSELYKNTEGRRLSVEEMRAGRDPNNYVSGGAPAPVGRQADKSVMSPDELRAFSTDKDNVKLSGGGLERRYLSDPPGGLLKAAGGAPLKASADPVPVGDPDSPLAFIRQQQQR